MSVNGIGAGYPAWRDNADFAPAGKAQRNGSGTGFAGRMADADAAGSSSPIRSGMRAAGQTSVLDAYRASAASGVRNVKPAYETYESENYRIVPDNEAGCFDIYNKQGERIGAFDYSDIKVRQDSQTGKLVCPIHKFPGSLKKYLPKKADCMVSYRYSSFRVDMVDCCLQLNFTIDL